MSEGPATAATTEVSFRPVALSGATATFILAGMTASVFGPLLVTLSHRFHLSLPTAGEVLTVFAVGDFMGVLVGWLGVKRLPGGVVLSGDLVLLAAGATGAALAHGWTVFLVFILLTGLGFGGLDFSLNTLLTRTREEGRAHRLSVVNAGFGVGAVLGPLLIIILHPRHFATLLIAMAIAAVILSTLNRGVHAPALRAEPLQLAISRMKSQRRPILLTFVVAYVLYIAVEASASGWMAAQLHGAGYSQTIGSVVTAGFWLGLAIGRTFGGALNRRFTHVELVLGGLVVVAALSLLCLSSPLALVAYPLMGLAIATVFPMGLHWYTLLCPHDTDGLAMMILFMFVGGALGPGTESLLVSAFGVHVVPLVIGAFALVDAVVFASARRFSPIVLV